MSTRSPAEVHVILIKTASSFVVVRTTAVVAVTGIWVVSRFGARQHSCGAHHDREDETHGEWFLGGVLRSFSCSAWRLGMILSW